MESNNPEIFTQILAVIDTDYIKTNYPKQNSPAWKKPVSINHPGQYLFASDPRGVNSGQGTADLNLNAWVGDGIDVSGTSIYENSVDAVIVYEIRLLHGDNLFSPFSTVTLQRAKAVTPDAQSPDKNGLPPILTPLNFNQLLSRVIGTGKADLSLQFGLYTLQDDGVTQSLYGYFSWNPSITIPSAA